MFVYSTVLFCSGYMVNNDVPMNVGFSDDMYFFDGLMDEVCEE